MIKKERKHQISENAVSCQTEFNFTSRVGTKLRRELKMFFKMLRLQDLSLTLVIDTDTLLLQMLQVKILRRINSD